MERDYQSIRSLIKPGDVIAFSGKDLPSEVVKLATQSEYVHVAIVIWRDANNILIAESHIDLSLPSVGTGKKALGVQLQWLDDRLAQQQSPTWWAALKTPLDEAGLAKLRQWSQEIESQNIPYDFLQAIGVGLESLGLKRYNQQDDRAYFCSELVTCALQLAGAIDDQLNPARQTPASVMAFSCFEPEVLLK
ncbi:MAG: hypothetical protein HC860_01325 [Alkalinema sp. RU_4_3]|nr:hypothetical protein [Alkalinema sp. RU_4_3]